MKKENIENVKKGLECLARMKSDKYIEVSCDCCPYRLVKDYCTPVIARDALILLKMAKFSNNLF